MDGGFSETVDSSWLVAYFVLLGLAVVQSLALGLQTWEHRRHARSSMRALGRHRPSGRAEVFAPCKGVDVDLEKNLRAVLRQDYHDYQVTFIVESADDPAVGVIRRVMADHASGGASPSRIPPTGGVATRLVIAGRAAQCGQKVHNLRCGTAGVSPQVKYLAFIDSDARPRPEWLRLLIGQLCEHDTGAVTGYRWFVPVRRSLANHLLYSMNCEIMSLLGRSSHYLVWGGSWGIRREVFESVDLHSAWAGTLSDDLVASRQLRQGRLRVQFEPACVVASPLDYSMGEMLSFVRRQYLLARFYVPDWWALAVSAAAFASLVWLSSLMVVVGGLWSGRPSAWAAACGCGVLYLLGVYRGWLRQDLVATYFPDWQARLRKARRFDVWANPLARLIHWLGVLSSVFGRHTTWRGIRYRVSPRGQVHVASRQDRPQRPSAQRRTACRSTGQVPCPTEVKAAQDDGHDQKPQSPTKKLASYRVAG
jgi:ceramide glucosyltransferase